MSEREFDGVVNLMPACRLCGAPAYPNASGLCEDCSRPEVAPWRGGFTVFRARWDDKGLLEEWIGLAWATSVEAEEAAKGWAL